MTRGQTMAAIVGVMGALAVTVAVAKASPKAPGGGGGSKPKPGDPGFDPYDPGSDGPGGGGGGGGGGSGGGSGSGGTGGGGGGGSGGGSGGTNGLPTRLTGEGGLVFGQLSSGGIPQDFDPAANGVRFSGDCSVVIVGRQFWAMGTLDLGTRGNKAEYSSCIEYGDIKSCIRNGQNACCFIDYKMNEQNVTSARVIGTALLQGLGPPCINQAPSQWPPAMKDFVLWLKRKVNQYVGESSGQADWT